MRNSFTNFKCNYTIDNTNFHYNKSLVIWGDYLYSTVKEKFSISELNMVKLPNYIKSIIIGILLSDGYITFSSRSKNGCLSLT